MHFLKADSYERIYGYASQYISRIKSLPDKSGIANPKPEDDVFAVLMEKGDVSRLLMHPKCHKLAAIVGIAPDGEEGQATLTISLLAVGEDGKVLNDHLAGHTKFQLQGEEVWPTKITISQFETFLPVPPSE